MIRSLFEEQQSAKQNREGRRLSLRVMESETGVAMTTLHALRKGDFKGIHTATLNTLCKYFGCGVGDLLEYVEDEPEPEPEPVNEGAHP